MKKEIKIELGGGLKPRDESYLNIDKIGSEFKIDMEKDRLPFDDKSVDDIFTQHTLEHIQNLIHVLNECWRVLKPGHEMEIIVPHKDKDRAYAITHCRFFTEESFLTLERPEFEEVYGIKRWKIIECRTNEQLDIYVRMTPIYDKILLNLGSGEHRLEGFENRDILYDGWKFEGGLDEYEDNSVDGITISHALYRVEEKDYPNVFSEFYRILKPGGIIRITEDDTRHWEWHDRKTDTTPTMFGSYFKKAGFKQIYKLKETDSFYEKGLLRQNYHPRAISFFIEAIK